MEGDNLSSTDLHLASNDTLLIGQVAEVQPRFNPDIVPDGQNYKTLQVNDDEGFLYLPFRLVFFSKLMSSMGRRGVGVSSVLCNRKVAGSNLPHATA